MLQRAQELKACVAQIFQAQIFQGVTESLEAKVQWKIQWYNCTVVILCTEWTMTEEIFGAHTHRLIQGGW